MVAHFETVAEVAADRTAVAGYNPEEHSWGGNSVAPEEQAGEDAASVPVGGAVGEDRVEIDRAAAGHAAEGAVHSATGDLNSHLQGRALAVPVDQELVGLCKVLNSAVHYSQLVDLDLVVGRCILRLPAGCKGKTCENLLYRHDSRLCHHEEHPHRVATAGVGVAVHIRTEDAAVGSLQEEDRVVEEEVVGSCIVGSQTFSGGCDPTDARTRRKESWVVAGEQNEGCDSGNEKRGLPMSNEC